MQKFFQQTPFATFTTIFLVCITGMVIINACRKMDRQSGEIPNPPDQTKEYRFFNEHLPSEPEEIALLHFMQRQNEKLRFVDKTVKQIGFPYWDKAVEISANSENAGRGNNEDATDVTFVLL